MFAVCVDLLNSVGNISFKFTIFVKLNLQIHELNGHLHTRMERLGSDIGLRIMAIEVSVTNLETSTRQQIDLGAAATESTTTHVNNEIAAMNKK